MIPSDILLSVGQGFTTDHLDLLDGQKHRVRLNGLRINTPGEIVMPIIIRGADGDDLGANYQAIERKLRQAREAALPRAPGDGVTLGVRARSTDMVFFDVRDGQLRRETDHPYSDAIEAVLTLQTSVYGRAAVISDAASGTLPTGGATILRADVPGDAEALVRVRVTDESSGEVVNRVRLARRSAAALSLGDWDPWVNATALPGASTNPDPTQFGGNFVSRVFSSNNWSGIARAVAPAGDYNRGRLDIWAAMFADSAVMAAPGALNSTLLGPFVPPNPTRRQQNTGQTAAGTTVSANWPSATLTNSLLLATVRVAKPAPAITRRQGTANSSTSASASVTWPLTTLADNLLIFTWHINSTQAVTLPAGWFIMDDVVAAGWRSGWAYRVGVPPQSGAVSIGLSESVFWAVSVQEHNGIRLTDTLQFSDVQVFAGQTTASIRTDAPETPRGLVLGFATVNSASSNQFSAWTDGATERFDVGGSALSDRVVVESKPHHVGATSVAVGPRLFVAVFGGQTPDTIVRTLPPDGYAIARQADILKDGSYLRIVQMYRQGAPSQSGAVQVGLSQEAAAQLSIIEYPNIRIDDALDAQASVGEVQETEAEIGPRIDSTTVPFISSALVVRPVTDPERFTARLALAAFAALANVSYSGWSSGFTEVADLGGLGVAERFTDGATSQLNVSVNASGPSLFAALIAIYKGLISTEPNPGVLPPGTYGFRVVAVDPAGSISNATATHNRVVTAAGSAINVTWNQPAGNVAFYRLYWQDPDGVIRYTVVGGTSHRLADHTDGVVVDALPSTTGGERTRPQARVRIGVVGEPALIAALPLVSLPLGAGTRLVHLGTVDLDEGWAVEIDARSVSGTNAAVAVGGLLLLPEEGMSQAVMEFSGLDLGVNRAWVYEADVWERASGRLETTGGADRGEVKTAGLFTLAPGDNLIHVHADIEDGVVNLSDAEVTVQLDIIPRVHWQIGDE